MRQTINGADFRRLIISAAASIEIHKQSINELNVFPVPDGDTAKRLGFDPAVMASPFITTIVDALSLLVYFGIAKVLLGV